MRQFYVLLIPLALLVGCSAPKDEQVEATSGQSPQISNGAPFIEERPEDYPYPPCLINPQTGECLVDLPFFPWPIPKPSSYSTLRDNELQHINRNSVGELADSLEYLLGQSGYSEFKYYNLPQGIAMTAQLERIKEDGKPFPSPQRWDINDISISVEDFSLSRLLRILVGAEPGFYRVLVFVVTDKNQVIRFDQAPDTEEQLIAIADSGAISLPSDIREVPYADNFNLSVLVYEMERKRSGVEAVMYKSGLTAKDHLNYTNIEL